MVANPEFKFALFGAGGYALEVMELYIQSGGNADSACFVDLNPSTNELMGIPVLSEDAVFRNLNGLIQFNVAISDPNRRSQIVQKALSKNFVPFSIVSSKASVSKNVSIGSGVIILENAKISPHSRIGNFVQVNYNSYLAHDSELGDFTTLSPGALCLGNVIVQEKVFIGAGALIRNGSILSPRVIGHGSTIGMGAIVLNNVEPGEVVYGNPGKAMKT